MKLWGTWGCSQCSVVDSVARQECGSSRKSGRRLKFDFFFLTLTKQTNKNQTEEMWQIWPVALELVTCQPGCLLMSWSSDCITQSTEISWVLMAWWPSLNLTPWGPFSARSELFHRPLSVYWKLGWHLLFSHLLAPAPDGRFLLRSPAGVRNVSEGSSGWENWNLVS